MNGDPYASIYSSALTGTILTRREQLAAFQDERGTHLALRFAAGKIENQATLLKYWAKTRKESAPNIADMLRQRSLEVRDHLAWLDRVVTQPLDEVRGTLLAAEGNAAQVYWSAIQPILPAHYGWTGRIGRGATDPVNQLLNYGYAILYHQIERAIVMAGLDPYAGFIHTDRPGKPSLTLDLIEEFRTEAVDRVVFGLINRDFAVIQEESGLLDAETRKRFAEKILAHLETTVPYQQKKYPLRHVIQMQARQVAAFVRGNEPEYIPFAATW